MRNETRSGACCFFRAAAVIWKSILIAMLFSACGFLASAQIAGLNTTIGNLRAHAQPDECFIALGHNLPFTKPPCLFSEPKVNQAYIWAMADSGPEIWFGTVANPQCVTQAVTFPTSTPYQTPSWACEFSQSPYASLLGVLGDFRPPQLFVYNKSTAQLTNVTPPKPVSPSNPLGIDPLLYVTLGIRAAVVAGDYILFAGQALSTTPQMNVFVFRASDHSYLGATTVNGYDSIRQFVVTNGQVYTAVGAGLNGGAVLRYTGTNGSIKFDQIGTLDGPGAYIAVHENRLFVTTWPTGTGSNIAGLFMSPPIPQTGFTAQTPASFTKVWSANDYEPDPVIAVTYAAGALADYDGYLYWGTIHVPWAATGVFLNVYGAPQTENDWIAAIIGTFRTATIFRGWNFGTQPQIDLLYGSSFLPAFAPPASNRPGKWNLVPNNMPANKQLPLLGPPGFGNPYNNYTWSMSVWNNRLWIGTMDWSYLAEQGTAALFAGAQQPIPVDVTQFFALQNFGADLFFFQSSQTPAVPENQSGIGNFTSYGIRNMVSSDKLYLGMANGSNLLATGIGPQGGWELIELQSNPSIGPLTLLTGFSCAPAIITGAGTTTCIATTNLPAGTASVTVGEIPVGPSGVTISAPITFNIAPGQTSGAVQLTVSDVAAPTSLAIIAGLNGGTRVTPLRIDPGTPKITAAVAGKGVQSPGVLWIDVTLTNTGNGNAQPVKVTDLSFQTLTGSGSVTVASPTPALPINAGNLLPGAFTTVRVYLNVPVTVKRFSITESGTVTSLAGTALKFLNGQSVFP
jgi:hypothetical protein